MEQLKTKLQAIKVEKDKITPEKIVEGNNIFGITGTAKLGIDTTDANALATDIVKDRTAYVNGTKVIGAMKVVGQENGMDYFRKDEVSGHLEIGNITLEGQSIAMPIRARSGDIEKGLVAIMSNHVSAILRFSDIIELINLDASQIAKGQTVLGIDGTYEGVDITTTADYQSCMILANDILGVTE